MAFERNIRIGIDSSGARRGARDVNRSLDSIGRGAGETGAALTSLRATFAGLIAGFGARELIQAADSFSLLNARLKLVTNSAEDFAFAQESVFNIANRTRQSIESTATLYARLARTTDQLGLSQLEISKITETINQALVVSGASTAEASSAIIQLSQGLASGVLRGEEFNSVTENGSRIARALADSLGLTIGQLRTLAQEGGLTAGVVSQALLEQSDVISREFSQIPTTVGQAFTVLQNELFKTGGQLDQLLGASNSLAGGVQFLSQNLDVLAAVVAGLLGTQIPSLVAAFLSLGGAFSAIPLLVGAAAASLVVLATRQTDAEVSAEEHKLAVERLNSVLGTSEKVSQQAAENARSEAEERFNAASGALAQAEAELELLKTREQGNGVLGGDVGAQARKILIESRIKELQEQRKTLEALAFGEFQGPSLPTSQGSGVNRAAQELSKQQEKRLASLESETTFQNNLLALRQAGFEEESAAIQNLIAQEDARRAGFSEDSTAFDDFVRLRNEQLTLERQITAENDKQSEASRVTRERAQRLTNITKEIQAAEEISQFRNENIFATQAEIEAQRVRIELQQEGVDLEGDYAKSLIASTQKLSELEDAQRRRNQLEREFENAVSSSMQKLIFEGEKATDVFRGLAQQILQAVINQTLISPIAGAIGGGLGSFFGGFFADGGRPPMNKVSIVGERGPELFVPDSAGTIVPNSQMSSFGGGGVAVSVPVDVQVINQGTPQQVESTERSRGPDGREIIRVIVRDTVRRGINNGDFDGAMGSSFGIRRRGLA